MKIGIVGGTGFYNLIDGLKELNVKTQFGDVPVFQGEYQGNDIFFLPRHGSDHGSLAHEVNYRGNMLALKELGSERVLSMCAVGSLNPEIPVGGFALLDQFVDVTTKRENTYGKYSVDISDPYCSDLRKDFIAAAEELNLSMRKTATYICVDGPRYETAAEINLYKSWGMDVVGMTNATEASLARELGLCYAVVTIATDLAAGISDVAPDLDMHKNIVKDNKDKIKELFLSTIIRISNKKECECTQAYDRAVKARAEKLGETVQTQCQSI